MKKALSLLLAAATVASMVSITALADASITIDAADFNANVYDDDDDTMSSYFDFSNNAIDGEAVPPGSIFYVLLTGGQLTNATTGDTTVINTADLKDSDLFKFKVDKDTNGKMISSIKLLTDKKVADEARADVVLEITVADTTSTSEIHTDGDLIFTAKKNTADLSATAYASGSDFVSGDEVIIPYSLWISNEKVENDANPDAGDRVYFSPEKNESNTLVWDEDRAALEFDADDDASDFYARLSTTTDRTVYAEYGDPVDAELWFYDFVGNPTIPSTSRAALTLGVPWDDDDDYVPDPESCFIYEKDADGYLTDVTELFSYSEDAYEIPGWTTKTRTLGTYVLSDTELDVEMIDEDEEPEDDSDVEIDDTESDITVSGGKENPGTGAADFVGISLAGAVVSLVTAGTVAVHRALQ